MIVIVMGASGAGKTTVGQALSAASGFTFHDADDLHPPVNVEKLRVGDPLTDEDRSPWLERVRSLVIALAHRREDAVLACSALRESYRQRLAGDSADVRWVYLRASRDVLRERLARRQGHFADPSILATQLAVLEEPENALVLDGARPVADLVQEICAAFAIDCRREPSSRT